MRRLENPAIESFARAVTRSEGFVPVLKAELRDQYPAHVVSIEDHLRMKDESGQLLLPELGTDGNETIGIFSDFSGDHPGARHHAYSFLVCGWNHSFAFQDEMARIRRHHGVGSKEIAYKSLKHGPTARALADYLRALDFLPGLLYTLVIEREVGSVFGPATKATSEWMTDAATFPGKREEASSGACRIASEARSFES